MTRRCIITSEGMRISKPGYDAGQGIEAQLSFSTNRKQFMLLESGSIPSLPSGGINVWFQKSYPFYPLGLVLEPRFPIYPTRWIVYNDHMLVDAAQMGDGSYPTVGQSLVWFIFARTR